MRTFLRTPALLDFALAIVFVRCDERKGKVGYKFRSELCEVFLPASYFKVVQKQRCFDESASRSTRASHTQHTHYTHARRTTLRTRAHTFSFYYISIFSLSLIHTLSGFTSHRGRKRERFFSLSRVRSPLSFSVSRVSAKAVHAKARASYCSHALLFDTNECFVFSRSLSFYVFFFLL